MSINCGAGLCKRAASFFYRIKEIFCFIANIHLIWIKEAPGRVAKSNKQWGKLARCSEIRIRNLHSPPV